MPDPTCEVVSSSFRWTPPPRKPHSFHNKLHISRYTLLSFLYMARAFLSHAAETLLFIVYATICEHWVSKLISLLTTISVVPFIHSFTIPILCTYGTYACLHFAATVDGMNYYYYYFYRLPAISSRIIIKCRSCVGSAQVVTNKSIYLTTVYLPYSPHELRWMNHRDTFSSSFNIGRASQQHHQSMLGIFLDPHCNNYETDTSFLVMVLTTTTIVNIPGAKRFLQWVSSLT